MINLSLGSHIDETQRAQNIREPQILLLKDSTLVQLESVGVAKVLQSEKNAVEILDTMDIWTHENCKIPNKNTQNGRIGSSGK